MHNIQERKPTENVCQTYKFSKNLPERFLKGKNLYFFDAEQN